MNFKQAKLLGKLSKGVYKFAPSFYFQVYRAYKRSSDSYKHELLRSLVMPDSVVLDIGAYIGHYTLFLSELVGDRGRVLAYEPDRENFRRLQRNAKNFSNVELYNFAVGDQTKIINFYLSADLNVDHRAYPTPGQHRRVLEVKQVALDDHLAAKLFKISLIKMDVEGYELSALTGMQQLLAKHQPKILTEFWPWGLKAAGSSAEAMLDLLKDNNYRVKLIDEKHKTVREFSLTELGNSEDEYYDILAEPK